MVKEICHDPMILSRKCTDATKEDLSVVTDLVDTLTANHEICVGMAANMIGVTKNIIAYTMEDIVCVMINPKILSRSGMFETEEGCLSWAGTHKTKRYKAIEVEYLDVKFKKHKKIFRGWTAQIIQHEIDHTNGIAV